MVEVNGRKFASNDAGAPMLCNSVCEALGRHAHIDYCRTKPGNECVGADIEHLAVKISPNPDRAKDSVSHAVFWKRTGFKDPYSREHQTEFAKCDHTCTGEEHGATTTSAAKPSYCTLSIFHAPHTGQSGQSGGYISGDGHAFNCVNPAVSHTAYHVIFLIDRSGSMSHHDRRPLANTPVYRDIRRVADNRLGSVYSSLFGFWTARDAAVRASGANAQRRDSYSIALFHHQPETCLENDFTRTPRQLLDVILRWDAGGGTNFNGALNAGQALMEKHWRTDQQPVVVFLSDGENGFSDNIMFNMCRRALALGKPLTFHSVSFGPDGSAEPLRRMAEIAQQVYSSAPRGAALSAPQNQPQCTFSKALDSVKLTETFLGIAESLRKPRGSLLRA